MKRKRRNNDKIETDSIKKTVANKEGTEKSKAKKTYKSFKTAYRDTKEKIWSKKCERVRLHRSFHRSYREDYKRPLQAPGLVAHAVNTLKIVFKNWRVFLPLLITVVLANIIFVGIMSEDTYTAVQDSLNDSYSLLEKGEIGRLGQAGLLLVSTVTTGGLSSGMSEVQQLLAIIFFAITWLVTIYYLRHLLAGNHPKFRDGLYNALTPLISSILVICLIFIHLIPIFIFIIIYQAAVSTEFLATPLYAFLFWLFGGLLILLSLYLLPVSLISLIATSVPGIYPMAAIHASTDLIQGRRTKFVIRIIFGIIFIAVMWVIVMLPLYWFDLFIKDMTDIFDGFPFVSLCLQVMTMFTTIYVTSYLYLFYRRMLDDPD